MTRELEKEIRSRAPGALLLLGSGARDGLEDVRIFSDCTRATVKTVGALLAAGEHAFAAVDNDELPDWAPILEQEGLRYGVDYIDALTYLFLSGKSAGRKLAVMYGNCQVHDYYDCLNLLEDFCRQYCAAYFKYEEYPRWKEDYLEQLLCLCDVLICTRESFDEKFRNCVAYVQRHNPPCRIIKIPTYSFRGYFPQTNPHIQQKARFDIIAETFNSFHREDVFINRLIDEGWEDRRIVDAVLSGACFSAQQIRKGFQDAIRQIYVMDRVSDVPIGRFVEENYRSRRLFKDPVHMEDCLAWHIALLLAEKLGCQRPGSLPEETIHYFTELPIYPEVAKNGELSWWGRGARINIRLADGMIQATTEEYVLRYAEFVRHAGAIQKSLHIAEEKDCVSEWFATQHES